MKKTPRLVEFDCDADSAGKLADAIRAYTEAAYPRGGSECAQVAREALFDAAAHCAAHPGGPLSLNKRQLPMLRSALHWWVDEGLGGTDDNGGRLRALLD